MARHRLHQALNEEQSRAPGHGAKGPREPLQGRRVGSRDGGQLVSTCHYPRIRTIPWSPSTSTMSPSRMVAVALPVPTTAGIPYSRATMAQWDRTPPASVTIAAAAANNCVQGAEVVSATRTSPRRSLLESERERRTFAGPRARPGEPALPCTSRASLDVGRGSAQELSNCPTERRVSG